MEDYQQRLDNAIIQLQRIIDERFEDHDSIQEAFNVLICELDEYRE